MERSKAAKFASSIFFEKFNDFDIYTEDTTPGYPKIVASFLSQALGSNVAIDKVFPLGQRGDVIKAARTRDHKGRRAAYIVDGDLFLLAGEREQIPENVIVLPRYCIENYMLDEDAILDFMDNEHILESRENLEARLNLQSWIQRSADGLRELFRYFAAAHRLRSDTPTVARGYKAIYLGADGEIDIGKCKKIANEIRAYLIETKGSAALDKALNYVDKNIDPDKCFTSTYVSAKDFTLPLLIIKIKSICPTKIPYINLKLRIAKNCKNPQFLEIVDPLRKILRIPNQHHSSTQ
ncbi:DUF4435 domain-containing protein [Pseudomonas putida]|uniref:DUF4435 domain-containing protein n=1 Tax=Pseudomonas putida TaxID=303 RepID=UPI0018ABAC42|nr:DUF4435 domain-containing protein [Pseudomonas putida]MBF8650703.1 DUF4435 domain-containing protein [Pseudomonas putida]MBF8655329.1 DUF4435 domain-containing protein [Pseudomonas putida]